MIETTDKLIHVGMIGLGLRGTSLLKDALDGHNNIKITVLCDISRDRLDIAKEEIALRNEPEPYVCTDYHEVLSHNDVDVVIIATGWETHVQIACEAMLSGKIVGCEVSGAYSVEDCWKLVHTYEKTHTPIMMLENCCYGRDELMLLNMVNQGVFGELVHCQGGYRHDIRSLCVDDCGLDHFRIKHFSARNCDYYPTHDLGPIAKLLGIGKGNRLLSLVSVASKAVGLNSYAIRNKGTDDAKSNVRIAQGDVITTTIKCSGGETIVLFLDTTLPRFYSRGLQVQGTLGMYCEDNLSVYIDNEENAKLDTNWSSQWGNVEQYRKDYDHPLWRSFSEKKEKGGHDGMDRIMLNVFFDAIRTGSHMPIDVYDMADWKCVTVLSEQSILQGGAPCLFPDFRNGRWVMD